MKCRLTIRACHLLIAVVLYADGSFRPDWARSAPDTHANPGHSKNGWNILRQHIRRRPTHGRWTTTHGGRDTIKRRIVFVQCTSIALPREPCAAWSVSLARSIDVRWKPTIPRMPLRPATLRISRSCTRTYMHRSATARAPTGSGCTFTPHRIRPAAENDPRKLPLHLE